MLARRARTEEEKREKSEDGDSSGDASTEKSTLPFFGWSGAGDGGLGAAAGAIVLQANAR